MIFIQVNSYFIFNILPYLHVIFKSFYLLFIVNETRLNEKLKILPIAVKKKNVPRKRLYNYLHQSDRSGSSLPKRVKFLTN